MLTMSNYFYLQGKTATSVICAPKYSRIQIRWNFIWPGTATQCQWKYSGHDYEIIYPPRHHQLHRRRGSVHFIRWPIRRQLLSITPMLIISQQVTWRPLSAIWAPQNRVICVSTVASCTRENMGWRSTFELTPVSSRWNANFAIDPSETPAIWISTCASTYRIKPQRLIRIFTSVISVPKSWFESGICSDISRWDISRRKARFVVLARTVWVMLAPLRVHVHPAMTRTRMPRSRHCKGWSRGLEFKNICDMREGKLSASQLRVCWYKRSYILLFTFNIRFALEKR